MKTILNHFFKLFFPQLCICCSSRLVSGEEHICLICQDALPGTNHLSVNDNKLEEFFAGRFLFKRIAAYALFTKGGSVQKIVHEFKYRDNPELGLFIGSLCGTDILNSAAFTDVDLIVPVPLHKNRLKERGYNQSLLLSQGISEKISKPVNSDNLVRIIDNPSQTHNSRSERWDNIKGVFRVEDQSAFENKHILLVDDVVTTGSTLEACAREILKCGGAKVSIYSFASAF